MITTWQKAHPVVEETRVVDGGATWDYFIDIGDKSETEKGKAKSENVNTAEGEVLHPFTLNGESHHFKVILSGEALDILMASNKFDNLLQKIDRFIGQLINGEKQPYIDPEKTEAFITDLTAFRSIIQASQKKFTQIMKNALKMNSKQDVNSLVEDEMAENAQHINNLFKKHKVSELGDLVLDLLGLPEEVKKLKAVLEHIEKHIKNENSVGDGHSVSALAAENYIGWLAIHINNIMKKENLIELSNLEVLGKKKSKARNLVRELAAEKSFIEVPRSSNEIIEKKKNIPAREKFVEAEIASFSRSMDVQLEPHILVMRTGSPAQATFDSIKAIFEGLTYDTIALEIGVDDDSMTKLQNMVTNFVQFALIKDSITGKVYNAPKPQVHQKKVLGDSEGMGKLKETLDNINKIVQNHAIPNADDAQEYEQRIKDALDSVELLQIFKQDGGAVEELTSNFYTRSNKLLDEMVTVEDALTSKTKLEAYLKSKPYGQATLFELFSGEVSKTQKHKDFAKVSEAIEKVYGVIYGDAESVKKFNLD